MSDVPQQAASRARSTTSALLLALLIVALPTHLAVAQQSHDALQHAGEWMLTIRTGQETVEGLLTLEQREKTLEGMFRPAADPDARATVTGSATGDTLTFAFDLEIPPGTHGEVEFVGEVETGIMAGTFENADGVMGEWTARRNS